MMKNIVMLGGGTGLSALIRGFKKINNINLSVIVSVSDDGGSTKEIRQTFKIPAVGDLRNVLVALSKDETYLEKILQFRFASNDQWLANHSLGNIVISAFIKMENDFYQGIEKLCSLLNLSGELIPVTDYNNIQLCAQYSDDTFAFGETKIPNINKRIKKIFLNHQEKIISNQKAINAIRNADYIIFGIGSLYTSLISTLVVPGVKDAILANKKANVIYFMNAVTEPGETHDMTMYDHINAIEQHLDYGVIDYCFVDNTKINSEVIKRYENEGSYILKKDEDFINSHVIIKECSLINRNDIYIRHDENKIAKVFKKFLEENF